MNQQTFILNYLWSSLLRRNKVMLDFFNQNEGLFCYFPQQICSPNSLKSESLRSESYTTILILINEMLMGEVIFKPVGWGEQQKRPQNYTFDQWKSSTF